MKKISSIVAILLLSGCSTTTSNTEKNKNVEAQVVAKPIHVVEEAVAPISLTVITSPDDARVRIMNIAPVYQAAMELKEGKYDVEVSKPGYLTYRKWVVVDKKTILTVNLDEVAATEAAN